MEWRGEQAVYQSQYLRCFAGCFLFVSLKKTLLASVNMTVRGELVGLKYNQCREKYLSVANRLNSLKVDAEFKALETHNSEKKHRL